MSDFVNTIDLLGDEAVTKAILNRTITEFNDDVATKVGPCAFFHCVSLTRVNLPNVTSVDVQSFSSCTALTSVDLSKATKLEGYAFNACVKLATIILRSGTVCTLDGTSALGGTPFASGNAGGTLLVPSALVESYKTATNWSTYWGYGHNRFLALEDYTLDGTITGEIDWDKLAT